MADAFGFVLILFRDVIPDVLSILVANGALFVATFLIHQGVSRFVGHKSRTQTRVVLATIIAAAAVFVGYYVYPSVNARTVVLTITSVVVYPLCAWNIARFTPPDLRASYRFTAVVFGAYGAWALVRALLTATSAPLTSLFTQTNLQIAAFIVLVMAIMLWTAGLVTMATQRLLRDLRLAQASERVLLEGAAREAREREQLFRLTFDQSPIGAALIGFDGRFIRANQTLCTTLGYSEAELLATDLSHITHPDDREPNTARAAALQAGLIESYASETRYLRNDGATLWVQLSGRLMKDANGAPLHHLALIENITARKGAEHTLRQRIEELVALNQIAQSLTTWTDLTSGLESVGAVLSQIFHASSVAVWTYDSRDETLHQLIGFEHGETCTNVQHLPLAATATGRTLLAHATATTVLLAADDALVAACQQAGATGQQRMLAVPLRARNEPIGLLCMCAAQPDYVYAPTDIALAQTIGGVLGSALENARLFAQAQVTAAEGERRRLARELHDSVSQALFAASRTAEVLPQIWELDPNEGRGALDDLRRFTSGALAEMRTLLLELRPRALTETPLHETLAHLAPVLATKQAISVETELAPVPLLPLDAQVALYRIAQESLNNVAKHAQAQHVTLQLHATPHYNLGQEWQGMVTMVIRDDGREYDLSQVPGGRMGLTSIRERAADIGAQLQIDSFPQAGTQVTVVWRGTAAEQKRNKP